MKYLSKIGALASLCAVLSGCSEKESAQGFTADTILIEVNGERLTKGDFDKYVELRMDMERLMNPRMQDESQALMQIVTSCINGWETRALLKQEARRNGVQVTAVERDAQLKKVAQQIARLRKVNPVSARHYDEGWIKKVQGMVEDEMRGQKMERILAGAENPPTEAEIQDHYKRLDDYNATCALSNALIYAHATNVWNELRNGADFAALAKRYTEVQDQTNGVWGTFGYDDLKRNSPLLANAVAAISTNQFTAPVEGDNGLMIAMLDKYEEPQAGTVNQTKESPLISKNNQFTIRRIYFRLPLTYARPTREEMKRFITEDKMNEKVGAAVDRMRAKADIRFPQGTNLVQKLCWSYIDMSAIGKSLPTTGLRMK